MQRESNAYLSIFTKGQSNNYKRVSSTPTDLHKRLMTTYFEERRQPDVGLFYDASRTREGRQSILDRLLFMCSIVYPWNTEKKLSDDMIRIEMKRTFFPHFKDKIIPLP